MRQPAQHLVPLTGLDVFAGELGGQRQPKEAGSGHRHDQRHDRENRRVEQALRVIQPLRAGDACRHGELRAQPLADLVDAPAGRRRRDQRLDDLQRDPESHGHSEYPPRERPS